MASQRTKFDHGTTPVQETHAGSSIARWRRHGPITRLISRAGLARC